jgi:rare lipoprotein A
MKLKFKISAIFFVTIFLTKFENLAFTQKLVLGSEQVGICSYYAERFDGQKTTNGELYDKNQFTAAHRTLPFNTLVAVTNPLTNISIVVRINDRGPYSRDRLIDVSDIAAEILGVKKHGVVKVTVRIVGFNSFQNLEAIDPDDQTAEIRNSKNL